MTYGLDPGGTPEGPICKGTSFTSRKRMPRVTISSLLSCYLPRGTRDAFLCTSLINQPLEAQLREAAACDGWGWQGRAISLDLHCFLCCSHGFPPEQLGGSALDENTEVPKISTGRSVRDERLERARLVPAAAAVKGRVNSESFPCCPSRTTAVPWIG